MKAKSDKPILQSAEFWLGQVAAIARLERTGRLSKAQAMDEVTETVKKMQQQQPPTKDGK